MPSSRCFDLLEGREAAARSRIRCARRRSPGEGQSIGRKLMYSPYRPSASSTSSCSPVIVIFDCSNARCFSNSTLHDRTAYRAFSSRPLIVEHAARVHSLQGFFHPLDGQNAAVILAEDHIDTSSQPIEHHDGPEPQPDENRQERKNPRVSFVRGSWKERFSVSTTSSYRALFRHRPSCFRLR